MMNNNDQQIIDMLKEKQAFHTAALSKINAALEVFQMDETDIVQRQNARKRAATPANKYTAIAGTKKSHKKFSLASPDVKAVLKAYGKEGFSVDDIIGSFKDKYYAIDKSKVQHALYQLLHAKKVVKKGKRDKQTIYAMK